MSEDVLVQVEGVSKKFCRHLKRSLWYGVCDIAGEVAGRNGDRDQLRPGEFWAVDDVSFELRRGQRLGLIGRNGAGKTTLLKMLNGLIKPDRGRITMRGRVGALIALGAGFNPILTGRENIYVNGSVLGLKKREIDAKLDEIIDFAEIREFIDAPVQSYSSGMQVRLGFAVASTLDPDILLLDEVLAVGDAAFRNKCYSRLGKLHTKTAVVFVSHNMNQISMVCDRTLLLHEGNMLDFGPVAEGLSRYAELSSSPDDSSGSSFESVEYPVSAVRFELPDDSISHGDVVRLTAHVRCARDVPDAILRVVFYNQTQVPCAEWNSRRVGELVTLKKGNNVISLDLGPLHMKSGEYPLGINLNDSTGLRMLCWSYKMHKVRMRSFTSVGPDVALSSNVVVSQPQ